MEKELNLKLRTQVLQMALGIEDLINEILKSFLRIDHEAKTKTLSYKSSSISFKTKIYLLFDLGKINKIQFESFDKFMEIRNQFMHNINVNSFCEIANHIDGLENWLTKNVSLPPDSLKVIQEITDIEEKREATLHFLFAKLNYDLSDIIVKMLEKDKVDSEKDWLYYVGYKYYGVVYKKLHPTLNIIFNEQIEILKKGAKKDFTIEDVNFLFKLSQDMLRLRLNSYIDNIFPKDSSERILFEDKLKK